MIYRHIIYMEYKSYKYSLWLSTHDWNCTSKCLAFQRLLSGNQPWLAGRSSISSVDSQVPCLMTGKWWSLHLVADFLKEFLARCCQCSYCLILLFIGQILNDLSKLLFFAFLFSSLSVLVALAVHLFFVCSFTPRKRWTHTHPHFQKRDIWIRRSELGGVHRI